MSGVVILNNCKFPQVSYMILQRVSPVTHSIGNCLKRVIVIVASVIFFKNPVSQQNVIGEFVRFLWPLKCSLSMGCLTVSEACSQNVHSHCHSHCHCACCLR